MGYSESIKNFRSINLKEFRRPGFLGTINKALQEHHQMTESKAGWKVVKKCPLCKSEKRKKEFEKYGINVYCCEDCTLRYFEKMPKDVRDVYDDEDYKPYFLEEYMKNVEYRKKRFGKERIDLINSIIDTKENVKLLDIGCGSGWFLEMAKENGFDVYGIELSKGLCEWTKKRLGVEIWNDPVESINTSIKFDVITLFDVIEHVEDPFQFVAGCKKLLAKNGIIVIFTPNFDSLAVNIMKENSNLICPSEHLVYFTERSVRFLSDKLQMKLMYYKTCGVDLGDLKSYYEWLGEEGMATACARLYDYIQPVVDVSSSGNHLRFILGK